MYDTTREKIKTYQEENSVDYPSLRTIIEWLKEEPDFLFKWGAVEENPVGEWETLLKEEHMAKMERREKEYLFLTPWQDPNFWLFTLAQKDKRKVAFITYATHPYATIEEVIEDKYVALYDGLRQIDNTLGFASFEDYAKNWGYNADSRRREKMYNLAKEEAQTLLDFFGQELYDLFLKCEGA